MASKSRRKNNGLTKSSWEFLPSYFQTDKNKKFLSSTFDQLINKPAIDRFYGYVGSKLTPNYDSRQDNYLESSSSLRNKYALDPALVIRDDENQIEKVLAFDDLLNAIQANDGNIKNLDSLLRSTYYSYDPPIDWDKLINFNQYYWLSNGPDTIVLSGISKTISSNYTVTDSANKESFIFSPNGFTSNPTLTLFRGQTYIFSVDSTSKFFIKTSSSSGTNNLYNFGVSGNGTEQVEFTVPNNAPSTLWYGSDKNPLQVGKFSIKNKTDTTTINVDNDIVGKKFYSSFVNDQPVSLMNGMKIRFTQDVLPTKYRNKEFYVEGVGKSIQLVDVTTLQTPEQNLAATISAPFDGTNFDDFPFDAFKNIPIVPEYITINRASKDRNSWSRYNRWFHVSVIELSAKINGKSFILNTELRAARPIVEFKPNLQLFQYGRNFLSNVTLFDTVTTDVFSTVENYPVEYAIDTKTRSTVIKNSYSVDGVFLDSGQTVIFNQDRDFLVRGKVYTVSVVMDVDNQGNKLNTGRINLVLAEQQPTNDDVVLILKGDSYSGTQWWYLNDQWQQAQTRKSRNDPPLFDLYDANGNSFYDPELSTYTGNKIFGYKIGVGRPDSVLGFPLSYSTDVRTAGMYEFTNFLVDTDTNNFYQTLNGVVNQIRADKTFFRINTDNQPTFHNVWTQTYEQPIPIIQVVESQQTIYDSNTNVTSIKIDSVFDSFLLDKNAVTVFANNVKINDYDVVSDKFHSYVILNGAVQSNITLKIITNLLPTDNGFYESPVCSTNNPYNQIVENLTFSELSNHVKSMVDRNTQFQGQYPGNSNLNSLDDISKYGSTIVINESPLTFAHNFITNSENSLISAIRQASDSYNTFKLSVISEIQQIEQDSDAADILDNILISLNKDKNTLFAYADSDMLAYRKNSITKHYRVTDTQNTIYPISRIFDLNSDQRGCILIYVDGVQLVHGKEYQFESDSAFVRVLANLNRGNTITIKEYTDTDLCFIAPTPSKLGLYPAFEPVLYTDTSYATGPVQVIQGHDGSIIRGYGDFRDQVILEFEKRIYNNIKAKYNLDLVDPTTYNVGYFRKNKFSKDDVNNIIETDFIKWVNFFGLDFESNTTYNIDNHKTYNYSSVVDANMGGNWRAIYFYYFDTDRPNTHPWEMLGFSTQPSWWTAKYGPAPYTAGNKILWSDLESGFIADGDRKGIDLRYARPGLSEIIPVDDGGNVIDIRQWALLGKIPAILAADDEWKFGDYGPIETTWRRSSHYPFAIQIAAALTSPARYAALLANTGNIIKNIVDQYVYSSSFDFISTVGLTKTLRNKDPISGWLYYVIESGKLRNRNYVDQLIKQLENSQTNLVHKMEGFLSKNKIQVLIDSVNPNSPDAGVLLPQEDFDLFFNSSEIAKTLSMSGIIVKKQAGYFTVNGYDADNPRFTILKPIHLNGDKTVNVGGKSRQFIEWRSGRFYQAGQIVSNKGQFYTVLVSNSAETIEPKFYSRLPELPVVGGVSVVKASQYETTENYVHYGTKFYSIQQVYDFIMGYGKWLESQGFVFDYFNEEIAKNINWDFSAAEFLYWTTQNWAEGSVISLSAFANSVQLQLDNYYVKDFRDPLDKWSIFTVDGSSLLPTQLNIVRDNNHCQISPRNTQEGIFFIKFNLIQKEHVLVLNNKTIFNDIIYDTKTGSRQFRVKLQGFKTAEWQGDYFSPGFMYDPAKISAWQTYTEYNTADVVKFAGNYYAALGNVSGSEKFDYGKWAVLPEKPSRDLLPNFNYKIDQFNDFYSLDIDNIDVAQQSMAQALIGYTPRPYLKNIFVNPIAQYKFYQGYIREKGTRNSLDKIAKAGLSASYGKIDYSEEWAFLSGWYGSYPTHKELQIPLTDSQFLETPQVIVLSENADDGRNDNFIYLRKTDLDIYDVDDYVAEQAFPVVNAKDNYQDLFTMPNAGYVRLDDVTATAWSEQDILDVANNIQIQESNTIWCANTKSGSWDVYRYSIIEPRIVSVQLQNTSIIFQTDKNHGLKIRDLVSVTRVDQTVDGIYRIKNVESLKRFTVDTELTELPDDTTIGLIAIFKSVRFNRFDDLADTRFTTKISFDELVWINSDKDQGWAVYKKVDNYIKSSNISGPQQLQSSFGENIIWPKNSRFFISSAPDFQDATLGFGRVYINQLVNFVPTFITSFSINPEQDYYYDSESTTGFGSSLAYNNQNQVIIVGAPLTGNIRSATTGNVRLVSNENTIVTSTASGLVKITKLDTTVFPAITTDVAVLSSPNPQDYAYFGNQVAIDADSGTRLLIAEYGHDQNTGILYYYNTDLELTSENIDFIQAITHESLEPGSEFGKSIAINHSAETLVVSAPGYGGGRGQVYVFTLDDNNYSLQQILDPTLLNLPKEFLVGDRFGHEVNISHDASYIFVTSLTAGRSSGSAGRVVIYKFNGQEYNLLQIIENPVDYGGLFFGQSVEISQDAKTLFISALGINRIRKKFENSSTGFDSSITAFFETVQDSGSVFVFERHNEKFVFSQQLSDAATTAGSKYGTSIAYQAPTLLVGAPATANESVLGEIFTINKQNAEKTTWQVYRHQDSLLDVAKIKKATLINSAKDQIVNYFEVLDPIKGKIPSLASQEIKFKTVYDPAIYSVGSSVVTVDLSTNWLDQHVGEVWWDLSAVSYIWYEQGDLKYRKNNWGSIFPGSSIDVYEWVKSEYLPSQWAELADTAVGLSQGISGEPKYPDDSVLSVGQYYNATSGTFTNVYYFWVKNKTLVPDNLQRRVSVYDVAQILTDPAFNNNTFLSIISPNSLSLTNFKTLLRNSDYSLNLMYSNVDTNIKRHTEWMLMDETTTKSVPTLLDKKFFDSLLGRDGLGNKVPDLELPEKMRYGVSVRPRQSMFKNRREAIRNVINYANGVLAETITTGRYDFSRLNSEESTPEIFSGRYDLIIEDSSQLNDIRVDGFRSARVSTVLDAYGKISTITIDDSGIGYGTLSPVFQSTSTWVGPTAVVEGNETLDIKLFVDVSGQIVDFNIGENNATFVEPPDIIIRPYTVLVLSDQSSGGKWALYVLRQNSWIKIQAQSFNTSLYWQYVDWVSPGFNENQPFIVAVNEPYDLNKVNVKDGQYVKILNSGDGRSIILQKTSGGYGTYDQNYDIVYSELGTIRISDNIWDTTNSIFGFDQIAAYDQTLYDQTADIEFENILLALKNDIFIGDLKNKWVGLFFSGVKYALSEQKMLDWAFKTSFINAKNVGIKLDQRSSYKFNTSENFYDYLNEVTPYHTQIRLFTPVYELLEPSNTRVSDFDLPTFYNRQTNSYQSIGFGSEQLLQEPYKTWFDNYKFSVESISVVDGGSGYNIPPKVTIIADPMDEITDIATAVAFISTGSVSAIQVTNPGYGYTKIPTILIEGGGNAQVADARAYAVLKNNTSRANTIGMKFDRTFPQNQIVDNTVTDTFVTDGSIDTFELTWAAQPEIDNISVMIINGDFGYKLLSDEYSIKMQSKPYRDAVQFGPDHKTLVTTVKVSKKLLPSTAIAINADTIFNTTRNSTTIYVTRIPGISAGQVVSFTDNSIGITTVQNVTNNVLVNGIRVTQIEVSPAIEFAIPLGTRLKFINPADATSVQITYNKNINLLNAADRILHYYHPRNGMPGNSLDQLMSGITFPGIQLLTLPFSYSSNWDQMGFDSVFWQDSDNLAKLDSIYDGGQMTFNAEQLEFTTAAGVNPEDIIIDGDTFISAASSHAPEEMIPGQIKESLGINVYTRVDNGTANIYSSTYQIVDNTTSNTFKLPSVPISSGSLLVSFNNKVLIENQEYSVNYDVPAITVFPQTTTGLVFVTIVGVGGKRFLSTDSVTVANTSTALVKSAAIYTDIKSAYVTVNGTQIGTDSSITPYYIIAATSGKNKRGAVKVFGLDGGTNTVTAWFFNAAGDEFNRINQQNVTFIGQTAIPLDFPPSGPWSQSTHAVVESNNRRLIPPNTTYYTVENQQRVFDIDPYNNYPPSSFDYTRLEVYVNGVVARDIFDYKLDTINSTVTFEVGYLKNGDTIAITILKDCDYKIVNGVLTIFPEANLQGGDELRIVTYSNHDQMFITQQVFDANYSGLYRMAYPVIDEDFIWVSVGRKVLANKVDYKVLPDKITVKIDDNIEYSQDDQVVITTFKKRLSDEVIAYRIFHDMLGRISYKRISKENSTYLMEPLYTTSTSIVVFDAGILPNPSPKNKIPGVILINGERIEYMEKTGNILSRLRRATLGTGARDFYPAGTTVIDQGMTQNIPFSEPVFREQIITTNDTVYAISDIDFETGITPHDQIQVFYGGKLLRKPTPDTVKLWSHDFSLAYDSGQNNSISEVGPEYEIDLEDKNLVLNFVPETGKIINIIKRQSTTWYEPGIGTPANGVSLLVANTPQAAFLRQKTAFLPDKYYYGKQ
jgi:hypothetical protein